MRPKSPQSNFNNEEEYFSDHDSDQDNHYSDDQAIDVDAKSIIDIF